MLLNLFFKNILILLILMFSISFVQAKDYGKYGNTYEIQEQDLLEYIQTKLKSVDIQKWQEDVKNNVKKSINRPQPTKLPYAQTNNIYYFDPSITLQKDYADNRGVVFGIKGTKLNPFNTVSLSNNLVFIDGDSKEQLNFAINYYNKNNHKVKIILMNGAIIDLMKQTKIRLYFDQKGLLIKKLNIQHIPAVVSQENDLLKIEEVVLDYE